MYEECICTKHWSSKQAQGHYKADMLYHEEMYRCMSACMLGFCDPTMPMGLLSEGYIHLHSVFPSLNGASGCVCTHKVTTILIYCNS